MSDMKTKIMSRLISGKGWEPGEVWEQLPDVFHSTDAEEQAVWRDANYHPKYIKDKK